MNTPRDRRPVARAGRPSGGLSRHVRGRLPARTALLLVGALLIGIAGVLGVLGVSDTQATAAASITQPVPASAPRQSTGPAPAQAGPAIPATPSRLASPSPVPATAPVVTSAAPSAPVTVTTTPQPATATRTIRLQPGDTLWGLGRRYATTVAALQQLNGLGTSTLIYAGATFRVPTAAPGTPSVMGPAARTTPTRTTVTPTHLAVAGSDGPPVGSAQQAAAAVFGPQYSCAANIITRESSWNPHATNPTSGAYGLAQALPGSKMATAGPDWRTNPTTQLAWMRSYVDGRYGGACAAWAFWQTHHWY